MCLEVLVKIFAEDILPIVTVRSSIYLVIVYGFVDVSGSGFGGTLIVNKYIKYRIGTWSSVVNLAFRGYNDIYKTAKCGAEIFKKRI